MKKVININFQGRVIPIEETSYEILKEYIESLRRYFANEEGMNEIVNDIESRIAELFSEQLKKGSVCITDEHVNAIIASMGRPADFDAQTGESTSTAYERTSTAGTTTGTAYTNTGSGYGRSRGRFTRNADDKIIGGVCSGLANYFGIDPVILRILFVVLSGALFWVYILLWLIVPSESLETNITRRLYRSADDKVVGGVAAGLAAYFNIEVWIPRLIFALPLVLGIISGTFNAVWWDWDFGFLPRIITGSLGSTLFVTYIILWIAVPVATTAAEKLQMRGERVDLNSIRDTVKNDMGNFKARAEKWGEEVKQTAEQFGERAKTWGENSGAYAKRFSSEAAPAAKRVGNGIGHIIGVLFKAFFLFIGAMIALALFGVLVGFLFGGFAVYPIKNFVLEGNWQNFLAWVALFGFFGVPVVGLLTWLVRRIIGVRSRNNYLGYVFSGLWFIGLAAGVILIASFAGNFKSKSGVEESLPMIQPASGKIAINVANSNMRYYDDNWFGAEWDEDMPFFGSNADSLMINTVRINVAKSKDSLYHLYRVRMSRGKTGTVARDLASRIDFNITQQDSLLLLPRGFGISQNEKFRNQQVIVVVEVPLGKKIEIDRSVNDYSWFSMNFNRRRNSRSEWDDDWNYSYAWRTNTEYVMTATGLERTFAPGSREPGRSTIEQRANQNDVERRIESTEDRQRYRYRETPEPVVDTVKPAVRISDITAVPVAAFANVF